MAVTYVGGATAFAITLFGYLYAPQSIYIALGVMIGLRAMLESSVRLN
jgi:hypothetical protein